MDAAAVLARLPADLPVAALEPFLSRVLPRTAGRSRAARVASGLSYAESLQRNGELVALRRRGVLLRPEARCPVCAKRFGDMALVVYPNGTTVHYACARAQPSRCPVTGREFGPDALRIGP